MIGGCQHVDATAHDVTIAAPRHQARPVAGVGSLAGRMPRRAGRRRRPGRAPSRRSRASCACGSAAAAGRGSARAAPPAARCPASRREPAAPTRGSPRRTSRFGSRGRGCAGDPVRSEQFRRLPGDRGVPLAHVLDPLDVGPRDDQRLGEQGGVAHDEGDVTGIHLGRSTQPPAQGDRRDAPAQQGDARQPGQDGAPRPRVQPGGCRPEHRPEPSGREQHRHRADDQQAPAAAAPPAVARPPGHLQLDDHPRRLGLGATEPVESREHAATGEPGAACSLLSTGGMRVSARRSPRRSPGRGRSRPTPSACAGRGRWPRSGAGHPSRAGP